VNRWLGLDSVRYMSVTTATQRRTAAHHETQRDKAEKARETGNSQLTGRFRR
jgi:predicted GIY-YIG superfamily endonuclease